MNYEKKVSPMLGILYTSFNIRNRILGDRVRSKFFGDEIDTHIIDTTLAGDTETWETGITRKPEDFSSWIIVQQHEDEENAIEGHKKWVRKLKENSELELKEIYVWNGLV